MKHLTGGVGLDARRLEAWEAPLPHVEDMHKHAHQATAPARPVSSELLGFTALHVGGGGHLGGMMARSAPR